VDPERPLSTQPPKPVVDAVDASGVQVSTPSRRERLPAVQADDLTGWLRAKGGRASTSMRRLALELGRSPAGVHVEIGRLAALGVLTAQAGPRGTVLTLERAARPN
jgi:predicted transcriptional regulator